MASLTEPSRYNSKTVNRVFEDSVGYSIRTVIIITAITS